ncbi:MAG: hypothetical protein IPG86_02785 [Chitinophagaceae bacterium]|nr:hypothetical protein [Chitinophagaceae bacterium]
MKTEQTTKFGCISAPMIDFPHEELIDEDDCHFYLVNKLLPDGLISPCCGCESRIRHNAANRLYGK